MIETSVYRSESMNMLIGLYNMARQVKTREDVINVRRIARQMCEVRCNEWFSISMQARNFIAVTAVATYNHAWVAKGKQPQEWTVYAETRYIVK